MISGVEVSKVSQSTLCFFRDCNSCGETRCNFSGEVIRTSCKSCIESSGSRSGR